MTFNHMTFIPHHFFSISVCARLRAFTSWSLILKAPYLIFFLLYLVVMPNFSNTFVTGIGLTHFTTFMVTTTIISISFIQVLHKKNSSKQLFLKGLPLQLPKVFHSITKKISGTGPLTSKYVSWNLFKIFHQEKGQGLLLRSSDSLYFQIKSRRPQILTHSQPSEYLSPL